MSLDRRDYKTSIPQLEARLSAVENVGKRGLANFDVLQDLLEKEIAERQRLYLKQDTSINTITVKMYYLMCASGVTPTPDTAGWSETMPKIDYSNDDQVLWYMSKTFRNGAVIETSTPQQVQLMDGVFAFINSVSGDAGWTTINGDTISTGRIQDHTGDNYFDLDDGTFNFGDGTNYVRQLGNGVEIQGTLSLSSAVGSGTLNDIVEDMADFAQDVIDINGDIQDLQDQIDGNITTWFYGYVPTLSNAPASSWSTDTDKDNHLGDLFYDTTTGYAYRFMKENNTYSWGQITDQDVTEALRLAGEAQDTADHKRRVFVSTPVPPYDVGDLWAEGSSGDIKKCKTAKADGESYSASDWELASKYTDDTVANQAQTTANGASYRTQYIYKQAVSGTNTMTGTTTWVTSTAESVTSDTAGLTPIWTTKRPTYRSNYPVIFVAIQSQTMTQSSGTTCSCTTPIKDDTTTVIDGGHITTGTIDASRITATVVNAINATANKIDAKNINVDGTLIVGASDVDNAINDIDVGSRNLLIGSNYLYNKIYAYSSATLTKTSGVTVSDWSATDATRISGTGGSSEIVAIAYALANYIAQTPMTQTIGETYSCSIYVKNNHATNAIRVRPNGSSSAGSTAYKTVNAGEAKLLTWTWTASTASNIQFNIATSSAGDAFNVTLWHPMYVVGNKATSWNPAPEDNEDYSRPNLIRSVENYDVTVTSNANTSYTYNRRNGSLLVTATAAGSTYKQVYVTDAVYNPSQYVGKPLTFSCSAITPSKSTLSPRLMVYAYVNGTTTALATITKDTTGLKASFIVPSGTTQMGIIYRIDQNKAEAANDYCYFNKVKLEIGATATNWIPEYTDANSTATSYITKIDDDGIYISPSSQSPTSGTEGNSVKIDGTGMEVFLGSTSVAKYGETARIGEEASYHSVIEADDFSIMDGDDTIFEIDSNGGTRQATYTKLSQGAKKTSAPTTYTKYINCRKNRAYTFTLYAPLGSSQVATKTFTDTSQSFTLTGTYMGSTNTINVSQTRVVSSTLVEIRIERIISAGDGGYANWAPFDITYTGTYNIPMLNIGGITYTEIGRVVLGGYEADTSITNISASANTSYTLGSIALDAGVWVVAVRARFTPSASGAHVSQITISNSETPTDTALDRLYAESTYFNQHNATFVLMPKNDEPLTYYVHGTANVAGTWNRTSDAAFSIRAVKIR